MKNPAKRIGSVNLPLPNGASGLNEMDSQGLVDAQRPGTPSIFTEADRNRVIHLACQRTESGTPRYSQHQIAEMCQMSQSWVSQILREADLKPHKTDYWCGKSPDPEFESKMIDIVGLYLNPLNTHWCYR
ncbi:MAG: hypothetical protein U5K72_01130 [Balneolaceae bacterium]|nr:hypothetical protein [Balneolaceae bacterium]